MIFITIAIDKGKKVRFSRFALLDLIRQSHIPCIGRRGAAYIPYVMRDRWRLPIAASRGRRHGLHPLNHARPTAPPHALHRAAGSAVHTPCIMGDRIREAILTRY